MCTKWVPKIGRYWLHKNQHWMVHMNKKVVSPQIRKYWITWTKATHWKTNFHFKNPGVSFVLATTNQICPFAGTGSTLKFKPSRSHRRCWRSACCVARDSRVLGVDLARHFWSRMLEKIKACLPCHLSEQSFGHWSESHGLICDVFLAKSWLTVLTECRYKLWHKLWHKYLSGFCQYKIGICSAVIPIILTEPNATYTN